jgi:hypothetical protein
MFIGEPISSLIPLFANMQKASIFSYMDAKAYKQCLLSVLMVPVQLLHYSGILYIPIGFTCPSLSYK